VLKVNVVVAAGVLAQPGIAVADDVGDGLGITAEAVGDLGAVEALGDQVGNLFVEVVVERGEMIAEGTREGKERKMEFDEAKRMEIAGQLAASAEEDKLDFFAGCALSGILAAMKTPVPGEKVPGWEDVCRDAYIGAERA
jgi:hypothetical protein